MKHLRLPPESIAAFAACVESAQTFADDQELDAIKALL
jgi:hypothetical protein